MSGKQLKCSNKIRNDCKMRAIETLDTLRKGKFG